MNDEKNSELFNKYVELSKKEDKVLFGGRLGMYRYFDMWQVIDEALKLVKSLRWFNYPNKLKYPRINQ